MGSAAVGAGQQAKRRSSGPSAVRSLRASGCTDGTRATAGSIPRNTTFVALGLSKTMTSTSRRRRRPSRARYRYGLREPPTREAKGNEVRRTPPSRRLRSNGRIPSGPVRRCRQGIRAPRSPGGASQMGSETISRASLRRGQIVAFWVHLTQRRDVGGVESERRIASLECGPPRSSRRQGGRDRAWKRCGTA